MRDDFVPDHYPPYVKHWMEAGVEAIDAASEAYFQELKEYGGYDEAMDVCPELINEQFLRLTARRELILASK